jgi:TPR repeat protein
MILSLILTAAAAGTPLPASDAPVHWNPSAWSSTITLCDRLAAHPSDPDKLTAGVSQPDLLAAGADLAIAACQTAVAADPNNPRLNYQLARSLGYSGRGAEAEAYRNKAVAGDYPQALFVVGFVYITGQGAPKDPCKAAALIRRSALAGRFAGLVGYPHYVVTGAFSTCQGVRSDPVELASFLERARAHSENNEYYRGILIDNLQADVAKLSATPLGPARVRRQNRR